MPSWRGLEAPWFKVAVNVPPLTVMLPVKVFDSLKVTRPASTTSPPLPEMPAVPLKVVPCVKPALLFKTSTPLSMIELVEAVVTVASEPPLPSSNEPAEIVVVVVKVFEAVSTRVPGPVLVSEPAPERTPPSVIV